jgi:hypothetical protein
MADNKPLWTLFLIFLSITASTTIIFRLDKFALELGIISGLIIMAMVGLYGLFEDKRWGSGIMLVLFASILINIGYLTFYLPFKGIMFIVASTTALVGLITSFPREKKQKYVIKTYKEDKEIIKKGTKEEVKKENKAVKKKATKKTTPKKAVKKKTTKKTTPKKVTKKI